MKKNDFFWEERSKKYGADLSGVMFKSLPKDLNIYLHNWQLSEITKVIDKNKSLKILDIGCGFGRLAKPLVNKYKNIKVDGIDISKTYVALFNQLLKGKGKAKAADATELPFPDKSYDVVYIVTTFMYLSSKSNQEKAFMEVNRVLKPEGKIVFIERSPLGYNFVTMWGLIDVLRGKKNKEIPAVSFSVNAVKKYFHKNNFLLEEMNGIPFFTLLIHPLIISFKLNESLGKILLNLAQGFDLMGRGLLTPSLYVSYIGVKR